MTVAEIIEQRVRDSFAVEYFNLLNESHQHAGPATDSHFKLTIISQDFEGQRLIKRHQGVYGLMQDLMQEPIHALSLHLFTPAEWEAKERAVADSPDCRGVGA